LANPSFGMGGPLPACGPGGTPRRAERSAALRRLRGPGQAASLLPVQPSRAGSHPYRSAASDPCRRSALAAGPLCGPANGTKDSREQRRPPPLPGGAAGAPSDCDRAMTTEQQTRAEGRGFMEDDRRAVPSPSTINHQPSTIGLDSVTLPVSVVVPARDEGESIDALLES